jgi:hypothetical protein
MIWIGRATIYIHLGRFEETGHILAVMDSGPEPRRTKYFLVKQHEKTPASPRS